MAQDTCCIDGCDDPMQARGWCNRHYQRWRKHGNPLTIKQNPRHYPAGTQCGIDECEAPVRSRNLCEVHYQRWWKHGDPLYVMRPKIEGCTVDGCDRPPRSQTAGLCEMHYYRLRRNGTVQPRGHSHLVTPEPRQWVSGTCRECGSTYVAPRPYDNGFCSAVHAHRNYVRLRHKRIKAVTVGPPVDLPVLAERDGWRCHICKRKVSRKTWSVDHLVPLSYGGEHSYTNVALAHRRCNSARKNTGAAQLQLIG